MPLVQYIGTTRKIDTVPGSGASWDPEEIREVAVDVAALLTAFTDSFIYYRADVLASGALSIADSAIHPGEDADFNRTFGGPMCVSSAIKTADALINNGPCLLYGYIVHAAVATAAVTITNGIDAATGVTVLTLPIGKAVGEYALPVGIYCDVGIFLNYAASATGSISLLYLPSIA